MAAACALGVEGVDRPTFHRGDGVFDKARFIESIGVDHHLNVHLVRHAQAAVDGGRCGAPIFVQFEAGRTCPHHFAYRIRERGVALARDTRIHRQAVKAPHHLADVPCARASRRQRAMRRTRATADHRRDARMQRIVELLRRDKVDVAVDPARSEDTPLARNGFGRGADDNIHAGLGIRVARLTDRMNTSVFQANVSLINPRMVHDQRVGDNGVDSTLIAGALGLAHPIADHLTAAEFDLFAIDGVIVFDLNNQVRISKPHTVPDSGAKHISIGRTRDFCRHQRSPITCWLKPKTRRSPDKGIKDTSRS